MTPRRRAIGGPAAITSLLSSLAVVLLNLGNTARGEGFGRWDTPVKNCRLAQGLVASPLQPQGQMCQRLRLEQNLEGLLSVHLIQPSAQQRFGNQSLIFGGALAEGQRSMRCDLNGACQPRWPIKLEVATVASNLATGQGVVSTLPMAQLARGTCLLERHTLLCQARDQKGRFWGARADY